MKSLYINLLFFFISFIVVLFVTVKIFAWTIDVPYGINGISNTSVRSDYYDGNNMAAQSDGKIIITGYENTDLHKSWKLERYNTDGNIDNTFGENGKVIIDFGYDTSIKGVIILKDDSFIAVGESNSARAGLLIAKFDINGSLDESYGNQGIVSTQLFDTEQIQPRDLQLDNSGRLVITGYQLYDGYNRSYMFISRYTPDGLIDNSFGNDGKILVNYPNAQYNSGANIDITKDNKIIIVGALGGVGGDPIIIYQYNDDGSIDTSFGDNGHVYEHFGSVHDISTDVAIQQDGKVVITGFSAGDYLLSPKLFVLRYTTDGIRDDHFANNGLFEDISDSYSKSNAVLTYSDGKIVIGGTYFDGNSFNPMIKRLNNDGSPDLTFSVNGTYILNLGYDAEIYNFVGRGDNVMYNAVSDGKMNYKLIKLIDELYTYPTATINPSPTNNILPTITPELIPSPTIGSSGNYVIVDDSKLGEGNSNDKWRYVGKSWVNCRSNSEFNCDFTDIKTTYSWSENANDTAILNFTGKQIAIIGSKGYMYGRMAITIDGSEEIIVDCYSSNILNQVVLWQSPKLKPGRHILNIRVKGDRNVNSTANRILIDEGLINKSN